MKRITGEVYVLESTKRSYAYLILGDEITLIDTGFPGRGKAILNELKSMNIKPEDIKNILLTHHDIDHVANAVLLQRLSGARLWASEEDGPYITGEKNRYGIKRLFPYIFHIKKPEKIFTYSKGQSIRGIEVIPAPGHTPGHVCLLYKDVLFLGDLLENPKGRFKPLGPLMTWNKTVLDKSIAKVRQLSFSWVCPAHGRPVESSCLI